tara:strand:+ start:1842 stop:2987 length:1146 start_codon:yes stop_codon:yes gene_type:complete
MIKKKNLGFIVNFSHKRWLGGSNYFFNLFEGIRLYSNNSITIFTGLNKKKLNPNFKKYKIVYLSILDPNKKINILINYLRLLILILFKRDFILEYTLNKYKIEILSHSFPLGKYSKIKSIYWIPDLQHLNLKNLFSIKKRFKRWFENFVSINNCSIILFSSKTVRKEFLLNFSIEKNKTAVLNFLNKLPTNKPTGKLFKKFINYYIISNQFWIHKNYDLIVDCLIELKKINIKPIIVSTGAKFDWRSSTYYESLIKKIKKNKLSNFKILGNISRQEQLSLIMNAKYLINPSKSEGWNSAIEEAKSLNTRVIASNLKVHREQLGSKGIYFDINNYHNLIKILKKMKLNQKRVKKINYKKLYKININNFEKFSKTYNKIVSKV